LELFKDKMRKIVDVQFNPALPHIEGHDDFAVFNF
jgi:hypothetical protein